MTATASTNGTCPKTPHEAAPYYFDRGFIPTPCHPRAKVPILEGWQDLRPTAEDLCNYFPPKTARNIGLVLGKPSQNLVDVDKDCPQAIAAAPHLLPATGWVSGRAGAPRSHSWYIVDEAPDHAGQKYYDIDDKTLLLELRSTGGQTVVPPSVHPSGEELRWEEFGEPAQVAIADLDATVRKTAAASLLAIHWPSPKSRSRQNAALGLAGGLLGAGWSVADVQRFLRAVAVAANDDEQDMRVNTADRTDKKLRAGKKVTGWGTLVKALGKQVGTALMTRLADWLKLPKKEKKEGDDGGDNGQRQSAATRLIGLALGSGLTLFHTKDQVAYAVIANHGHLETWPLKSSGFRRWLARLFYKAEAKSAGAQAIADALNVLEGKAQFDADELDVHVRVAQVGGKIYLDLANVAWQAVEIDTQGWRVVDQPPVRFKRSKGMLALPLPERGGKLEELRPLVNVRDDDGWRLLVGWLVALLRERGPYPVLVLCGEQGTAKTTLGRFLRRLVDPSVTMLRSEPRDCRDLMIAASGGWVIAYDNLSFLPQWLSDAVCRLATGGGFATRQLYTDDEEVVFDAMRPVMLTSITDVVTSSDLLDRALFLTLQQIDDDHRLTEEELEGRFCRAWPRILGALLDAVSAGLRCLPSTKLDRLPRMADFALWVEAVGCGTGWHPGAFLQSYEANRGDVNAIALEACPVALVVLKWLDTVESFEGTATELLERLNGHADDLVKRQKGWPAKANQLTNILRRMAPNLRRTNVDIQFHKSSKHGRAVTLAKKRNSSSPSSPPPRHGGKAEEENGLGTEAHTGQPSSADRPGTSDDRPQEAGGDDAADAGPVGERSPPAPHKAFHGKDLAADGDDEDDPLQLLSGSSAAPRTYLLVSNAADLGMVHAALEESVYIGVDCETTGLHPRRDRLRLLTLNCDTTDGGRFTYLVDVSQVDPRPLWGLLAERRLIFHNAHFDLQFMAALGFETKALIHDVMILSRLLTAGSRDGNALADLTERHLGIKLDKAAQASDWSGDLTDAQLCYAALDVEHLVPLHQKLTQEIKTAGLERVAEIERRCLPAWLWMATAGLPVDRSAWEDLARQSRAECDVLLDELHRLAPPRAGELPGVGACWNFNSGTQVLELLRQLGFPVEDTKDATLAGIDHPLVDLLRRYRYAKWLDGTYGESFLRFIEPDGRVYGTWVQTGNEAGRSSSKEPNLQQIPRQSAYRRAFAAKSGKVLVKADFAAAHLRIACKIAGEEKMLAAFRANHDLHRLTAAALIGKPEAEVTKQDRQIAKAVAFGLLYGMGPKTLRVYALQNYGVAMTLEQAKRHRATFFTTYPGLARWHRRTEADRAGQTETRTLAGRRRFLDPKTPIMHRLNSPVLGTEADAAKTALALLWERRADCPGARPVAFVHDEILVEADAGQADVAAAWVKQAMVDGMAPLLDPVPVEVEVKVATTWAGD
jgi:DNA polymerase I-like protein with 3'-5' exonuclease and polymerase domains